MSNTNFKLKQTSDHFLPDHQKLYDSESTTAASLFYQSVSASTITKNLNALPPLPFRFHISAYQTQIATK